MKGRTGNLYPSKVLQFLQKETMKNSKNFGVGNGKNKSSPIMKYSVQVSDSAVYYRLLRDTVPGTWGELYTDIEGPGGLEEYRNGSVTVRQTHHTVER
ncbi:hypothetical protein MC885_020693 [Smutsia gigantea]|nr:hypothetical protein MC885_020693 [Smutsia gigantea]